MTYWWHRKLETKDMAKTLKTAFASDLLDALEEIEAGFIRGSVRILDKYVAPEITEIFAELMSRPQVNLEKINVRQLLDWLNRSRKYSGWWIPGGQYGERIVDAAKVRKELARRPHVPNQQEARAIRQKAAMLARSGKQRHSKR